MFFVRAYLTAGGERRARGGGVSHRAGLGARVVCHESLAGSEGCPSLWEVRVCALLSQSWRGDPLVRRRAGNYRTMEGGVRIREGATDAEPRHGRGGRGCRR